jgi:class 3 adenylate cyclase/tetratricopeptide (TPR) repeat protein
MNRFYYFILIIVITFPFSQAMARKDGKDLLDSLLKENNSVYYQKKEDTGRVKLLNKISAEFIDINPDEGFNYGLQALKLATKLQSAFGITDAHINIGDNCNAKFDYNQSLQHYLLALNVIAPENDKKRLAEINDKIGKVYVKIYDYPVALEYFFNALKIEEEIGNKMNIPDILLDIAFLYRISLGDSSKELEYNLRALKMQEQFGDKNSIAHIKIRIGNYYIAKLDYVNALEYYLEALKLYEEMGNKEGIVSANSNIGNMYICKGDNEMAIDYLLVSLKNADKCNSKELMIVNLVDISAAYLHIFRDKFKVPIEDDDMLYMYDDSDRSESIGVNSLEKKMLLKKITAYMLRAIALCKETKDNKELWRCYRFISNVYLLKGDYKKAYEFANNFRVIRDSLFPEENRNKALRIDLKNEYERLRLSDSLKTSYRATINSIQLNKESSYTFLGISGTVLLLGFSFFIFRERMKSEQERKMSDNLLLNILPVEVASELKINGSVKTKQYDHVTVLYTDFVNFTQKSEGMGPKELIDELHECFKAFDEITDKYGIEKIKTIGDAYLAVCGLPTPDPCHAEKIIKAAKEITSFMTERQARLGGKTFEVRIGINSGTVLAGIVGQKKFSFDIWGDTVNTAIKIEQLSQPGKINISQATFLLVKDQFEFSYFGESFDNRHELIKMYFAG